MAGALAALLLRLIQLQLVQAERLAGIAQRQQLATVVLSPHRGRLLDRRGRPLAVNLEATSIYAVPSAIEDRRAFAVRLAPILGLTEGEVLARLARGRHFAWLLRKAPAEAVARVRTLGLDGQVGFRAEDQRVYPNGPLAAPVLGFVGIDNQGLGGVELAYDGALRGQTGEAVAAHDGMGRLLVETQRTTVEPVDGADVLLTVDQVIQHIAERELDGAMARTQARSGLVAVMEVPTGEILALAQRPTFDPNRGAQAAPELWMNRAVGGVFEPGSTFKIFVAAAALDAGAVDPGERFLDPGVLRVGGHVIRNANGKRHGWVTLTDILRYSSNVGSAQVASRLGAEALYRYLRAFGFGAATRIDLPGEVTGIIPPPAAWRAPALQTISFGQGISVTPAQLLTAAAALGNDGLLVRPHVVRGVRDRAGRTTAVTSGQTGRRTVTPAAARAVLRMMAATVADGTGRLAQIEGYPVAGKTGTAQKPSAAGGYDPDRYVASFIGLVPADRPQLAVLVILDEPQGAYYGSEVAAPVFREVAAQALWYLQVPPRRQLSEPRSP
jgi:stage V sporulation protein D (sporulation-specific penicillin-binding protein)